MQMHMPLFLNLFAIFECVRPFGLDSWRFERHFRLLCGCWSDHMNRCTVAGMTNQFPLLLVDGQCAVCNQPLCGGREITLAKIRLVGVVERRTAYFHLLVIPETGICGARLQTGIEFKCPGRQRGLIQTAEQVVFSTFTDLFLL